MKKAILAAALGATLSLPAYAGQNYLNLGLGAVFADEEDLDFGPSAQLGYGYEMSDHWDVEAFVTYSNLDVDGNSGAQDANYERFGVGVDFLYNLSRDRDLNWFALAGLSGARTKFDATGFNETNYAPSVEIGGGFKKKLANHNFDLRADLRYRTDIHRGNEKYDNDIFYEWVAHIGIAIPFGGHSAPVATAPAPFIEPAPEPMPIEAEPVNEPIVLPGVTFPLDSAQLTSSARSTLDDVIAILNDQPELTIEVVGHADDTGPSDYNLELSKARATTVKEYFVENGIDSSRFVTSGAGEAEPVATNATTDGRQQNRRVSFIMR